jgi:hypothetical protein
VIYERFFDLEKGAKDEDRVVPKLWLSCYESKTPLNDWDIESFTWITASMLFSFPLTFNLNHYMEFSSDSIDAEDTHILW